MLCSILIAGVVCIVISYCLLEAYSVGTVLIYSQQIIQYSVVDNINLLHASCMHVIPWKHFFKKFQNSEVNTS